MPRKIVTNYGKSLSFDGATNGVTVTGFKLSTTAFSVAFWAKVRKFTTNDRVFDQQDAGPANGATIIESTNGLSFVIRNVGTNVCNINSTHMNTETWYHVVATYEVDSAKFYINGVQVGATDTSVTMTDSTAVLLIGKRNGGSNFFNGYLKDFLVYNRVLSLSEITDLMYRRIIPSSPQVYYEFNDSLADSSGSGNTGSAVGSLTYSTQAPSTTRTAASSRLSLPQNYLSNAGTVIESFSTIGDWTPSPASPGSLDVTSDSLYGTCLAITSATSANNKQAIKTISQLFTKDIFTFFVKPDDYTDTVVIGFSSQTTFATVYMNYSISTTNLQKNKWNIVRVAKSEFTANGGEVWTNTMIRMRFRNVSNSATEPSTTLFTDLRIERSYRPKILLQSDNVGSLSTIEKMYPILNTAGLKGTVFVESGLIGVAGKLTLADLQTLYSAGWDLGNHTTDHADLTALTIDEAEANVLACGGFLSSNGFTRGADHIAFPLGATNDTVSAMLERNGFKTGRKATDRTQTVPVADMFKLDAYTIKAADSLATVKGYVDTAINKGSTTILMIEGLADSSPAAQEWLTSNYQSLIDYIKTKVVSNQLDVVTVSEWYNGLTSPRREVTTRTDV